MHIGGHFIQPSSSHNTHSTISLIEHDFHSYVPFESFVYHNQSLTGDTAASLYCATGMISATHEERPWSEVLKSTNKVHKHVCGHSN